MGKTFKQLRNEAMADPSRRAAIEREKRKLFERVHHSIKANPNTMERLRKS